jgi:hypothetical protein
MVQDVRRWPVDDFLSRKITRKIPKLKAKKEETIMRKNKMTITISSLIGIFLIAALVLVPATLTRAETVKFKLIGPITRIEVVPIPDVKGHAIGLLERRGVAIYENGETAAWHTRATFDSIRGQGGSFNGYSSYSFADGSIIVSKFQGTTWVPPGEKLSSLKGTGKYIKGTGRFEGIKGKLSFSGKYITPYTKDKTKGDAIMEVTGTYTLPKK